MQTASLRCRCCLRPCPAVRTASLRCVFVINPAGRSRALPWPAAQPRRPAARAAPAVKGSGLMAWQQKCHLGSWVPSSQGCWRSVTMETPNELNLVTDPYLFLICGPLGTLAGNQLENNLVTYQKENYLYLFIQVELISAFDACPTKDSHHLPAAQNATPKPRPAQSTATSCHAQPCPGPRGYTAGVLPCSQPARAPQLAHVDKHPPAPLLGGFNILCWYLLLIFLCALSLR